MRAESVANYGLLARWFHLPIWVVLISLVWFIRFYLHAGRLWLAWAVCGIRTFSLGLNFYFTPNLTFREITSIDHLSWWGGEMVNVAVGKPNPWTAVGQLSLWLFSVYVIDAAVTIWRRGQRKRALLIGSSILFFAITSTAQAVLVIWGGMHAPFIVSFPFIGILAVMTYELSLDFVRSAQVSIELKESQQQMRQAAAAARLAVWTWDVRKNIIWVTTEGRPLHGVPNENEITLEQFLETVYPADRAATRHAVESSLAGEGKFSAEFRVELPNGALRWITAFGKTDFDESGAPRQLRGVSLDATDRKRTELEALQNRNELAHLSRVTMLGELAGSLAHELNQPLASILSNAQAAQRFLARDDADLGEVREILNDIVAQDKRAGEVIHRLRLLLKKGEVQRAPLDANGVVLDVLKLVRSDLVNQQVSADSELAPNLPLVLGDHVQLQQVLLNLVMNASDSITAANSADRHIVVRTALGGADHVSIDVRDHGGGIPAGGLERVFEPFFTTKANGLGLGLSVCRSILSAHGGTLDAHNNTDGGATFRFNLPLAKGGNQSSVISHQ